MAVEHAAAVLLALVAWDCDMYLQEFDVDKILEKQVPEGEKIVCPKPEAVPILQYASHISEIGLAITEIMSQRETWIANYDNGYYIGTCIPGLLIIIYQMVVDAKL